MLFRAKNFLELNVMKDISKHDFAAIYFSYSEKPQNTQVAKYNIEAQCYDDHKVREEVSRVQ